MKSVMHHVFSQVPKADIPRSSFDRSHGLKTTFDSGYLIPIFVDEVLPGDTFNLRANLFGRLATPLTPVMDNIFLDGFFFFVPMRLIWSNFKKFMGEQASPGDSIDYLEPTMTATAGTGFTEGSLSDYFGIPTKVPGLVVNSKFHRAYNLIWNEWFRDENLQTPATVDLGDGPDTVANYVLRKRGKRHDYFTSALPWPQKGTAVSVPLGTSAPIVRTGTGSPIVRVASTGNISTVNSGLTNQTTTGLLLTQTSTLAQLDPNGTLIADLSSATAATINALRQAFAVQKMYEKDARGGTRYIELVKSHFGVTSPDARLQRPEFLGGFTSPVMMSPIAQTSSTDGTSPQGNLTAMGTVHAGGKGFGASFTEHGLLLGLVSVRADLNYQQGLQRMFFRSTRNDYYWPSFAHLGEQSVLNKEIYAQGTANPTADAATFGYQERYAEYRYKPSQVTGLFRSNATQSLDIWHLAQEFGSLPALNSAFIEESPPIDRIVAVPSQPEFLLDCYFQLNCARPMPIYSVPGQIDRF